MMTGGYPHDSGNLHFTIEWILKVAADPAARRKRSPAKARVEAVAVLTRLQLTSTRSPKSSQPTVISF